MSNEELQEAIARADDFLDMLKDTCHDQYDKIKELEEEIKKLKKYEKQYIIEAGTNYILTERINKSLEYIEEHIRDKQLPRDYEYKIRNILKGEDNE